MGRIQILTAVMVVCALMGCTRMVYVPTETIHTETYSDTVRMVSLSRDSVYHRDSIYIEGETIVKERWRYRYVSRIDTLYKSRTDTVHHYAEVGKMIEVERRPSWWERFRMAAFWWLAATSTLSLMWIFRKSICRLILRMITLIK